MQPVEVTPGWHLVGLGAEGDGIGVQGVRVWQVHWEATGETIVVHHPEHLGHHCTLPAYTVQSDDGAAVQFAAGEVSTGVWAFYTPE